MGKVFVFLRFYTKLNKFLNFEVHSIAPALVLSTMVVYNFFFIG